MAGHVTAKWFTKDHSVPSANDTVLAQTHTTQRVAACAKPDNAFPPTPQRANFRPQQPFGLTRFLGKSPTKIDLQITNPSTTSPANLKVETRFVR
jgi:hypothetical protein